MIATLLGGDHRPEQFGGEVEGAPHRAADAESVGLHRPFVTAEEDVVAPTVDPQTVHHVVEIIVGELDPGQRRDPWPGALEELRHRHLHTGHRGDVVVVERYAWRGCRHRCTPLDQSGHTDGPEEEGSQAGDAVGTAPRRMGSQRTAVGECRRADVHEDAESRWGAQQPPLRDLLPLRDGERNPLAGRSADEGPGHPRVHQEGRIRADGVEMQVTVARQRGERRGHQPHRRSALDHVAAPGNPSTAAHQPGQPFPLTALSGRLNSTA